jgi:hypothetical protein
MSAAVFKLYGRTNPKADLVFHSKPPDYPTALRLGAELFGKGNFLVEAPSTFKYTTKAVRLTKNQRKNLILKSI